MKISKISSTREPNTTSRAPTTSIGRDNLCGSTPMITTSAITACSSRSTWWFGPRSTSQGANRVCWSSASRCYPGACAPKGRSTTRWCTTSHVRLLRLDVGLRDWRRRIPAIRLARFGVVRGRACRPSDGSGLSVGRAAPVENGREGHEDRQQRDRPKQRGDDGVLHGPGVDRGGGVGVSEQVAAGGGDGADRVPVGDCAEYLGHALGRDEGVGDDGEWEQDDQADALG